MNKKWKAYFRAARLPSLLFLLLPVSYGQMWGGWSFSFSWPVLWVYSFTVFFHLWLIFANDLSDYENDKVNSDYTFCSGGSRVLVDGSLTKEDLWRGVWLMTFLSLAAIIFLSLSLSSFFPLWCAGICYFLLWSYSFPPFSLVKRGFGEVAQTLGLGVMLPVLGFMAHKGEWILFPWGRLFWTLPLYFCCALTTSLPDIRADERVGKRTLGVCLGYEATGMFLSYFILMVMMAMKFLFVFSAKENLWWWGALCLLVVQMGGQKAEFASKLLSLRLFSLLLLCLSLIFLTIALSTEQVSPYDFAFLCFLLTIPVGFIGIKRKDLWRPGMKMMGVSLPFAFTEIWFSPSYWHPRSVGQFLERWGFCLEDFWFVSMLGALSFSLSPFLLGLKFKTFPDAPRWFVKQWVSLSSVLALFLFWQWIPLIWLSCLFMVSFFVSVITSRPDLTKVGLVGGFALGILYAGIMKAFYGVYPQAVTQVWKGISGLAFCGIPLEEVCYGFCAGLAGSVFYPFFWRCLLIPVEKKSKFL